MKTRIAIGAGLLLTLGSAVAGTLIYGHAATPNGQEASTQAATAATLEAIAMLESNTTYMDYVAPKVPI
jgi:hypothetical protein